MLDAPQPVVLGVARAVQHGAHAEGEALDVWGLDVDDEVAEAVVAAAHGGLVGDVGVDAVHDPALVAVTPAGDHDELVAAAIGSVPGTRTSPRC